MHVRQQIRQAIATACTGLATTGTRVYTARVYPLEEADLPGLLIASGSESVQPATIHGPGIRERFYRLRVVAIVRALVDVDATLDTIAAEVEIAIAGATLPSPGCSITLSDIGEPELSGEQQQPIGQMTMTFEARYYAVDNAPDVAL
jgi:hypothetical protein